MDDLIDFPCSPLWVSHYASKGMTRDYPREYYEDHELRERINGLEEEVKSLRRELAFKDNVKPKRHKTVDV
jgi:hypothetical protein